jgi:hypothetical protein
MFILIGNMGVRKIENKRRKYITQFSNEGINYSNR